MAPSHDPPAPPHYRIGVDVGGTNTDVAVLAAGEVVAVRKTPTTADVTAGLVAALGAVLEEARIAPADVGFVVIGTTHFTNAVVERRGLTPTAVVRLCLPAGQSLRPMSDWPADLAAAVGEHSYLAPGGLEYDGRPIAPFDAAAIDRIAADINEHALRAIAICGVYAPVDDGVERRAAQQLRERCPQADITTSATIGGLGLLERENAAILNGALLALARRTVASLRAGLHGCGLACPFFLSQNDGTLISAERVERFPVLTFASGPTNSMRGAAFLTGLREAIVIDVGGTTTDVGLLQDGFPRAASTTVDVGGVRTNFRMPDVFSIGLGGGSRVAGEAGGITVGPTSVGFEITQRALVFGGDVLTATDIAVASGRARVGDPARLAGLDRRRVEAAQRRIDALLEEAVDRARISAARLPVIAVGGGSLLVPDTLAGLDVLRPGHHAVANAVGAAIAQVSGEIDRVYSLDRQPRAEALAAAEQLATEEAVLAGADPATIAVLERDDTPLAYLPGNATRIRVKVVGELRGRG